MLNRLSAHILDAIPGAAIWMTPLLCALGGVFFPQFTLLLSGVGALYVTIRFLIAGVANLRGMRLLQHWQQIDWQWHYTQHAGPASLRWDDVYHVVIIPNYNEPLDLLRSTLKTLGRAELATTRITVILAMEAAEAGCIQKAQQLQAEFAACFEGFYFTVHPRGLPGEIQCKSANLAWAARWAKRELVDRQNRAMDHILVTTMDADTRWHPAYFSALTALYALDSARHMRFWQAPPRYQDNIEALPPVMRLVHDYSSAIELAHLAASWWWGLPISSYSLSLRLIDRAGYWDTDVIADEWHMFIKAFFVTQTRLRVIPVFLPFRVRVTAGQTLLESIRNRYLQTLRHAWGSKEITYVVRQMVAHAGMPLLPGIRLLARVAHDVVMSGFGWMLVTFGALLPLLFHPQLLVTFVEAPFMVPGLLLLLLSMGLTFVQGAIHAVLEGRLRDQEVPAQSVADAEHVTRLSFLLLPVLIFLFVTLPVLHAQTLLLLGRSLQFRVTQKQ